MCACVDRFFVAIAYQMAEPHWAGAFSVLSPGNGVSVGVVHHPTENPGVLIIPGQVTDCPPLVVKGQLHPPVVLSTVSQGVINS